MTEQNLTELTNEELRELCRETEETTLKIYIIREMNTSPNPADEGPEIKRFRGEDGWSKAVSYRDALYSEDGIKSYISIKKT